MAKILYLARHAKSSWTDMSTSDFDRPLNKRGQRDAPEMGRRLHSRGVKPDIILCSPAGRARETIELMLPELGMEMNVIRFEQSIYEASMETLATLVQSLPDRCTSAMLIGHNPSMGWLAQELSDRYIDRMPTCAVASIELETDSWKDAGACATRLIDFDWPKKAE